MSSSNSLISQEMVPLIEDYTKFDSEESTTEKNFQGYLVIFGSFCSIFVTFGFMNTTGAIQSYLIQNELNQSSNSDIGWIFSTYFFFALGGGLIIGPIFDSKGSNLLKYIGSVLVILGFFSIGECKTVIQFIFCYGVLLGIGNSCLITISFGSVSQWFESGEVGLALGLVSIGGGIGGVVWILILRSLLPKIGFKYCMRLFGLISTILLIMTCLFVKNKIIKKNTNHYSIFVFKDLFNDEIYLFFAISLVLCDFAFTSCTGYISSYIIDCGYSEDDSFLVLLTLNCFSILGRFVPNYLGDKYGSFNIMFLTCFLTSLNMILLWLPFGQNLKIMFLFACFHGLFGLAIGSLAPTCCGKISKVEDFGKRYGTVYFLVAIANLISMPIAGSLINEIDYSNMIIMAGTVQLIGSLFWLLTRIRAVGTEMFIKF